MVKRRRRRVAKRKKTEAGAFLKSLKSTRELTKGLTTIEEFAKSVRSSDEL